MSNTSDQNTCARSCSFAAALIGILVALLLMFMSGWGFFSAVILGIVLAMIAGFGLRAMLCSDASASDGALGAAAVASAAATAPKAEPAPAPPAEPASDVTPAPASDQASAAAEEPVSVIKPSTSLPGQDELASRKGTWKYEGGKS